MYYSIKEAIQNFISPTSQNISIPISFDKLKNIIKQMKNCICRIKFREEGSGFFCLIPFPDKSNLLPVLMTN